MQKVVVDSSVIVKWVNQDKEDHLEEADAILKDAQNGKILLSAPELAKYEVGNAIWKKRLELPQALDSLGTISALPVQFIEHTSELSFETYRLCHNSKTITYYDASFVALAKQEKAILVTDNPKHQNRFEGVRVTPLKDYQLNS